MFIQQVLGKEPDWDEQWKVIEMEGQTIVGIVR
jgi:hypothetical protein